jgi:anti-sigma-K factor RskA
MSRTGPDHERWADATGAYLLGALPEHELPGFETHVAGCDACREELAALRTASDALPASAPTVEPPPQLKGRIMAEVEREAALLQAAGAPADRPPQDARPARARRPWLRWAAPAAAALAVAAAALAVSLSGGGEHVVPLVVDRAQAGGAHGELHMQDGGAMLVVDGLPEPGAGRVYQVWVKPPGRAPRPTNALFVPSRDGSASTGVPLKVHEGDAVLVTSEPAGGSRTPTRVPLLSAVMS